MIETMDNMTIVCMYGIVAVLTAGLALVSDGIVMDSGNVEDLNK